MTMRIIQTLLPSHDVQPVVRVEGMKITVEETAVVWGNRSWTLPETFYDVTADATERTAVEGHLCVDRASGELELVVDEFLMGSETGYEFGEGSPYERLVPYLFMMKVPAGATDLGGVGVEVRTVVPSLPEEG